MGHTSAKALLSTDSAQRNLGAYAVSGFRNARFHAGRCALVALTVLSAWAASTNVKGTLKKTPDGKPVIETAGGKTIGLDGDEETMGVLTDERLDGTAFEVRGELTSEDHLRVGPIHKHSMWALRDGKRKSISYWCALCSIRAYTPGICPCCQEETELDLRDAEGESL